MGKIFNVENPFWQFVSKLCNAVLLNMIWFVFSLPIITIGASSTALYYVNMKVQREREGSSLLREFVHSFKMNFRQSTIIWLICLVLEVFFGLDIYFYWFQDNETGSFIMVLFLVLAFIWFMMIHYIFAVQAKFVNPIKKTFLFSVLLPFKFWYYTIPMMLITLAFVVGSIYWPPLVVFGIGTANFFECFFIRKVFAKYVKEDDDEEEVPEEESEIPHMIFDDSGNSHTILTAEGFKDEEQQ